MKKNPGLRHKGIYLWLSTYIQDNRQIPSIVNEKIVISVEVWGGATSLVMALGIARFSSSIDKESLKEKKVCIDTAK